MEESRIGVLWFRKENYPRFRELTGPSVPDTYEEWRALADFQNKQWALAGHFVEKLLVDPDDLAVFAWDRFGEINADARAAYAAHLMALRDSEGPERQ